MPKILKNGQIHEDGWQPSEPEASIIDEQRFLTLAQFQANTALSKVGVQLEPDDDAGALADHLDRIAIVAVHFPAFMDGRGFSQARTLRDHGFTGEIRATGAFIRDQLGYLARVGVDAFAVGEDAELASWLAAFEEISDSYQSLTPSSSPLFRRRDTQSA